MPVQNAEIAAMFDQTADLLEVKGDNPFRVRAYRRAARTIEGLPQSVRSMLAANADLSELPGIGKDLAGKIADIVASEHFALLDALKKKLPGDLGAMAALPGLGPKRIKLLYDRLKVRTLDDLREAIDKGRLRKIRGFGAVTEQKIAAALAKPIETRRYKLSVAEAEADALAAYLKDSGRVVVAGSYRRRRDTVGDLDVLVLAKHGAAVGDRLTQYANVADVIAHGPTRTTVVLRSGLQVDVRAVPEQSYGAALLYFTGSKAHNIALRNIANKHKWKLNEYGLFAGRRRIAGATEEEIYEKLGLAYVPPEMREDRGEVALAQSGKLPKLIGVGDIRGDLHVHSDWTDGTATIEEMAQAAQARGLGYMALTDHSRRQTMSHGLDAARVARQCREIDKINARLNGFTILKGIEVDILKDGRLDLIRRDLGAARRRRRLGAFLFRSAARCPDRPHHSRHEQSARHSDRPSDRAPDRRTRTLRSRHGSPDIRGRRSRLLPRDQRPAGAPRPQRSARAYGAKQRRQVRDLDRCPHGELVPVHPLRHRSGPARLAHRSGRHQYAAARRIAQVS